MTVGLVVVGAGGFGRETVDVVRAVNAAGQDQLDLLGVVDDSPSDINLKRLSALGVDHLGGVDRWLSSARDTEFVIAIGNPAMRQQVAERFEAAGHRAATLIHPSAVLGSVHEIGEGSIICGGVQVSTNVRLGRHVHLNPNTTIGHDTEIADFVSINPGAIVSGECVLEHSALVGAGATVLQGLTVGVGAIVGAAACVVRDVPSRSTVKGIPAR